MKHEKFTWNDVCERTPFKTLITKGAAFQFDQTCIARIRREIGELIANLSKLYLAMKEQEEAEKRAKRRQVKSEVPKDKKQAEGRSEKEVAASTGTTAADSSEEGTAAAGFSSEKETAPSETTTAASSEEEGTGAVNTQNTGSNDLEMSTEAGDDMSLEATTDEQNEEDAAISSEKENISQEETSPQSGASIEKLTGAKDGSDEEVIEMMKTSPLI